MKEKINVAIIGGSGFVGGELCRILLKHKNINKIFPTSREEKDFGRIHTNLANSGLKFCSIESVISNKDIDVVFLCTKSKESIKFAEVFINKKLIVIDLSGAFRFKSPEKYFQAYGNKNKKKNLIKLAAYGASEFNFNEIESSQLIANPGCYALCALLTLAPLAKFKFVDFKKIIKIHAINGTTGAGNKIRKELQHVNVVENMLAYNADGHRHAPEIEEKLRVFFNLDKIKIDLNTAHGNFRRGIFMQISLEIKNKNFIKISRDTLLKIYKSFYNKKIKNNNFIFINDLKKIGKKNDKDYLIYPQLINVIGTNNCLIGIDYDKNKKIIKLISVLDNLVKGAAGSAVQNMNIRLNFDLNEGLNDLGLF